MKLELILRDMKVYEYQSTIAPSVGEIVRRLHGTMESWRVKEVRHVIDDKFVCERIILIVEEI